MKVISLMDDVCDNKEYKFEHGLSIYIEDGDKKYLVDTGQSGKFIYNANKLGVDISDIDAVFISHNHYDHTDGLSDFFKENKKAKVYLKDESKFDYYAKPFMKVSMKKGILSKNSERFLFVDHEYKVGNIHILSDTNADKEFFCQDTRLLMKKGNKFIQDEFNHELFIAIEKDDMVHVISSCSHRGIVNILKSVKSKFGKKIGIVYAGLHMSKNNGKAMNCSDEYFEKVCAELDNIGFEKIYTCHCTGLCAYGKLKEKFGDRIDYAQSGFELDL